MKILLALMVPLATSDSAAAPDDRVADLATQVQRWIAAEDTAPDTIYETILGTHGQLESALTILESHYETSERSRRVAAQLLFRHGEFASALQQIDVLMAGGGIPADARMRARLLDAMGRTESARQAYEALLERIDNDTEETWLRLRLALLDVRRGASGADSLEAFAQQQSDVEIRNRCAIVLALAGQPQQAIALFTVTGQGKAEFGQRIRLAEWAIAANVPTEAQRLAWEALLAARLKRDKHYALTVLVETHRLDDSIDALLTRFEAAPELPAEAREVWIDLLRETGRFDEAVRLFRDRGEASFTTAMRRELLEMYREAGRDEQMVDVYGQLIQKAPQVLEWRIGLSRHHLESGDRPAAQAVWSNVNEPHLSAADRLAAASALMDLGLDGDAIACVERCITDRKGHYEALMFLFSLHRDRGHGAEAEAALQRMDAIAPPQAPQRMALAEAYERIGNKKKAVEILEGIRVSRGPEDSGEDLEMRLAWLYSEIGEEDKAMHHWQALWRQVNSIPRRRFVEDRLMSVASRLGKLADVAIELEEKLLDGKADERDSGLLVRLYTRVSDPVSAAEIIDEYLKQTGGSAVDALNEKSRVYLACKDYFNYEKTIKELIAIDPEGRPDYLRQQVMSQLERGHPEEARAVLVQLRELEEGPEGAEFEAGILALSGLREDAIVAYRKALARHSQRIESYLLLANVLSEVGRKQRAIGMFQYLAETAENDDLFTIAIDGLLNMEAPPAVMTWARRITLERLTRRSDKMYLYQLLSDLADAQSDRKGMRAALEGSLAMAGPRRASVLRELMDLAKGQRGAASDDDRHLAYGRRLIGLADIVPPQVYLDLGAAFLKSGAVSNAAKTFSLARDVTDYDAFRMRTANLFEQQRYLREALRTYQRVLSSRATDIGLMVKVGELHEQLGRDTQARSLYLRGLDLLLARESLVTTGHKEEDDDKEEDPRRFWQPRNIGDYEKYRDRLLRGVLVTTTDSQVEELLTEQLALVHADLEALPPVAPDQPSRKLEHHPRVDRRAAVIRRLCFAFTRIVTAETLDLELLNHFPKDVALLKQLCVQRLDWGFVGSVRRVLAGAARSEEDKQPVRQLLGEALDEDRGRGLPSRQVSRLVLPLVVSGQDEAASALVLRADFSDVKKKEDLEVLSGLLSTALFLGDSDAVLLVARAWIRGLVKHGQAYESSEIVSRCRPLLSTAESRSLAEFIVTLVLEDPKKASGLLYVISELNRSFEKPLLEKDQILELLEKMEGRNHYGFSTLLTLLPVEERPAGLRLVLDKVPPTGQAMFLLSLVRETKDPFDDDFSSFVLLAIENALPKADSIFPFYVTELSNAQANHELITRIADLLKDDARVGQAARVLKATMLKKQGSIDEAVAMATELFGELRGGPEDWEIMQVRRQIEEEFLPEHLDRFLAAVDALVEAEGSTLALVKLRLDLVGKKDDPGLSVKALREAIDQHPEEKTLLRQLQRQLSRSGRRVEALDVQAQLLQLDEDDDKQRKALARAWEKLENPVRALAIMATSEEDGTEARDQHEKFEAPTLQKLKDAIAADQSEDAHRMFRRLWREFPVNEAPRHMVMMSIAPTLHMPRDRDPDQEHRRRRGGLDAFSEIEPQEKPDPPTAFEVVADAPFGTAELRAVRRSRDANAMAQDDGLTRGLARVLVADSDRETVLLELVDAASAGEAGKLDFAILLGLLEDEAAQDLDLKPLLGDVMRTLDPRDVGQLRRLARIYARQGATEEAARLYRWCATLTTTGWFYRGGVTVTTRQLVKDVREALDGDARLAVIETILQLSDPGERVWTRESFETLVLQTWIDLAGPDVAVQKCGDLMKDIVAMEKAPHRQSARLAAGLFARAGDIDSALRCLEIALCRFEPSDFDPEYRWWVQARGHRLGHEDFRRLFPVDASEWSAAVEWYRAAANALQEWSDAGRVEASTLIEPLCILALRLHDLGDVEEAHQLAKTLQDAHGMTTGRLLWIMDTSRRLGLSEWADATQRRLFDERRLNIYRIPDVIDDIRASDGPQAALVASQAASEYTLFADLVDGAISVAKEAGDDAATRHWEQLKSEAEQAKATLADALLQK